MEFSHGMFRCKTKFNIYIVFQVQLIFVKIVKSRDNCLISWPKKGHKSFVNQSCAGTPMPKLLA